MSAHALTRHEQDIHFGRRKALPDALEAEQALLGALLLRNDCIEDIPANFEAGHFSEALHRKMFAEMRALREDGKPFSPITLKSRLPADKIGDMTVSQYMARLMSEAVNFSGVRDWCIAITMASGCREIFETGAETQQLAFSEEMQILPGIDAAIRRLSEIRETMVGEEATFSLADAIDSSLDAVNDAYRGSKAEGLDPGIPEVLQLTGPWQRGQLIIIGGGVKQGKTALAMQCLFEIAKTTPVFLYSGEMTVKQIMMREQARRTGISARQQQRGQVKDAEMSELVRAGAEIKRSHHIEIDCRKMTLEQISRKARALKKSHGIGAVFVDHIGKIQWEGKMQYEDEFRQGQIATSRLKDLAMELDLPVIALTHLKKAAFQDYQGRNAEDRLKAVLHRRPTYRDLVGNMDKDADQVLIPFQPRPILAGMEPGEGTAEWNVWNHLMSETHGKAEIILSLSRESEFPRRRDIAWDGNSTSYGPPYKQAQNARELF